MVDAALGKSGGWTSKLAAGDMGVLLDDLPALLGVLGLKVVDVNTVVVDPVIARAYDAIARKAVATRSLLIEGEQ